MKTASATAAVALAIGGSDSGGGAGLQADLKVFHALGIFGTTVVTAITAQNPVRISAMENVSPRLIAAQMDRVFEAFPVAAVKTGMLGQAATIETVVARLRRQRPCRLVVDPVLVASSGRRLLRRDAIAVLGRALLPLATVVTPNLAEAETLGGRAIGSLAQMRDSARALADRFGVPFLLKGGHLGGTKLATDVLCIGGTVLEYPATRLARLEVHGTGCTFAAAITAYLALGQELPEAVRGAKRLINGALRRVLTLGQQRALNV